ncbi:MAG TPA: cytochrome c3 family protein [Planctomycetota bacterium]
MELVLFGATVLAAVLLLLFRAHSARGTALGIAVLVLGAAAASAALWRPHHDARVAHAPAGRADELYASSQRCRSCHPDQYATWEGSYHRTMTQLASPAAVLGDFEDVILEDRGRRYRLQREGQDYWVELDDPLLDTQNLPPSHPLRLRPPRVRERVAMTTGSHHFQVYWLQRLGMEDDSGSYYQFPWVWLIEDARWIPAVDSFLRPPPPADQPVDMPVWNYYCLPCHSVAGQPQQVRDADSGRRTEHSRVAELGIACEACHGPAENHVEVNGSPLRRYRLHLADAGDDTVVNPGRLDKERGAGVCGQCHSFAFPHDEGEWTVHGSPFRPGQDLDAALLVVRTAELSSNRELARWQRRDPGLFAGGFWKDGTVRVAGREYNGLLETGCFQRGEMDCLSCHTPHGDDPDDQLKPGMRGDLACLQCHESRYRQTAHTQHAVGSPGSRCYDCHMPHTTYGLFTAMRSHRVDSPSAANSAATGRPNACNLCHLDKPLGWTAAKLAEWYGQEMPALDAEQRERSAALQWLLAGDGAQRGVVAWHLAWEPAMQASGRGWQAPFLAERLDDPYSAVRKIAGNALRLQPGFEDFDYDFLAPPVVRRRAADAAFALWNATGRELPKSPAAAYFRANGSLDRGALEQLARRRDDASVRISE